MVRMIDDELTSWKYFFKSELLIQNNQSNEFLDRVSVKMTLDLKE